MWSFSYLVVLGRGEGSVCCVLMFVGRDRSRRIGRRLRIRNMILRVCRRRRVRRRRGTMSMGRSEGVGSDWIELRRFD